MITNLEMTITFHGPFAISTGTASGGIDQRVDPDNPIPASSLKGLMRHEASVGLGAPAPWIGRVFGDQQQHSARWRWTDARFAKPPMPSLWSRVKVDAQGRSEERFLMIGEQLWAGSASFSVVPAAGADAADRLLLRAAARHISSLGHQRRRGLGWVSVTDEQDWTEQDSADLISAISTGGPQ